MSCTDPNFLQSPLNTLLASLDAEFENVTSRDVVLAYELLHGRLIVVMGWIEEREARAAKLLRMDVDGLIPSLQTLKHYSIQLGQVISRDVLALTREHSDSQSFEITSQEETIQEGSLEVDEYPPNTSSQELDTFEDDMEMERIELLESVSINALRLLGLLVCSEKLVLLLSGAYKLPYFRIQLTKYMQKKHKTACSKLYLRFYPLLYFTVSGTKGLLYYAYGHSLALDFLHPSSKTLKSVMTWSIL